MSKAFFDNMENKCKVIKHVGLTMDVYGNPAKKTVLPCDHIPSWKGAESCKVCPQPCPDPCEEKEDTVQKDGDEKESFNPENIASSGNRVPSSNRVKTVRSAVELTLPTLPANEANSSVQTNPEKAKE